MQEERRDLIAILFIFMYSILHIFNLKKV